MKLPDNEPLEAEDYWTVTDTWKQEWERGVQVKIRSNEAVQCAMSKSDQIRRDCALCNVHKNRNRSTFSLHHGQ